MTERPECLHQCSTCRCHSTGTSRVRTTDRATPAATGPCGCTSGSQPRPGSPTARPGRPERCTTRWGRPVRCWWVGLRLFDALPSRVELEIARVIDTPEATHIRYRVRR